MEPCGRGRGGWGGWKGLLAAVCLLLLVLGARSAAAEGRADLVVFSGPINPVSASFIVGSLRQAQGEGARLFILELNTPGGDESSMRRIARAFLASTVPTVVWVAPRGARAGSAGTFLAYAAQLAAMAPGTEIGAAHPVAAGGANLPSVENEKVTRDAVAMITAWAETNHRNAAWAAQAVTRAASLPAAAALREHVINAVADTPAQLLRALNGQVAYLASGPVHLRTAHLVVYTGTAPWWTQAAMALLDPNLDYLLMTLGFWALVAEVYHPTLLAGIGGIIALAIGLMGLGTFSPSATGVFLILLGLVLLAVDVKAATHGVLSVGGGVAFVLGSLLLFPPLPALSPAGAPSPPALDPWVIGLGTAVTLALPAVMAAALVRLRRSRVPSVPALAGAVGVTETPVSSETMGTVRLQGSHWRARSEGPALPAGTRVQVTGVQGLLLTVRPLPDEEGQPPQGESQPSSGNAGG